MHWSHSLVCFLTGTLHGICAGGPVSWGVTLLPTGLCERSRGKLASQGDGDGFHPAARHSGTSGPEDGRRHHPPWRCPAIPGWSRSLLRKGGGRVCHRKPREGPAPTGGQREGETAHQRSKALRQAALTSVQHDLLLLTPVTGANENDKTERLETTLRVSENAQRRSCRGRNGTGAG